MSGNVMTLNETGSFGASGTYSIQGESGSFAITITTSSTATFNWASGVRPNSNATWAGNSQSDDSYSNSVRLRIAPDRVSASPASFEGIRKTIHASLNRAILFGFR